MNSKLPFLALLLVLGLRCVNSEILPVDYPAPTITSSIFITVNDIDGLPVPDADIKIENEFFKTDELGTCVILNRVMAERAYVTVNKPGFFSGTRTLYVSEGQIQYAKVVLFAKNEVGSFSATTGGQIDMSQSSSVIFPRDAVVLKDGTPYDGEVHISGYTILADDPDLSVKMPGMLEAVNSFGAQGVLASYGMMAVEIHTASGDELKVKEGQRVDLRIDVPETMRENAPSEIPMWYFDEETGEWKEDGIGLFNGTGYEARVSHFTVWNCDQWNQSVKWYGRFVAESGDPLTNLKVCLTVLSSQTVSCQFTDNSGSIFENLPANEPISLTIYDDCNNIVYFKHIGPFTQDASYGTATISGLTGTPLFSTITGVGVDCQGQPIKYGLAIITVGTNHYVSTINSIDGSFKKEFINCSLGGMEVIVLDQSTQKRSDPKQLDYAEVSNAGTLWACEERFVSLNLEFQGFPGQYVFTNPVASILYAEQRTSIYADDGSSSGMFFTFDFVGFEPGECTIGSFRGIIKLPNDQIVFLLSLELELIEYGPVGGEIKGLISGVLNGGGNGQGGGGETNFNGEFSVIRAQ